MVVMGLSLIFLRERGRGGGKSWGGGGGGPGWVPG